MSNDTLPNGRTFRFWDDATSCTKEYHVACNHPQASDDNSGTADEPFLTIDRAAQAAQPGEKIIVHDGVYHECIRPPRGGTAPDCMIAYEAARGERVVITGAEPWQPVAEPSRGWSIPAVPGGETVWMAELPADRFGAYNPFLARNAYDHLPQYGNIQDPDWLRRALLRRGSVFCDGQPLTQVLFARELAAQDSAFWVEEPGLRVHFRLPGDCDPRSCTLEVSAREQVFAPALLGLGYIRVSGFTLENAADGLPVPQRAALSASRGHHWIIEDNIIRHANACGIDVGMQSWNAVKTEPCGHHIIRRNTISDCGVCGIAGARGVEHTLIEDNLIERIGGLNLERMYECAAIKFHFCKHSLMRRNTIRRTRHAGGIWLDVNNDNCRITGNTFADIKTITAAVYSEMNPDTNMIDNNVFWDIRSGCMPPGRVADDKPAVPVEGSAVRADCNESLIVAHNFFGRIQAYAVAFSLVQADRNSQGRTGLCRANTAVNNVFFKCPHRIHLGRREENVCDGNLYDQRDDSLSFHIAYPEPACHQNLAGWQRYFGLDTHSEHALIEADFDVESGRPTWRLLEGKPPACRSLKGADTGKAVGPRPA